MTHKIYKIVNNVNGKVYIGQISKEIEDRLSTHIKNAKKKINRYLYDAMNLYGYKSFSTELLETLEVKAEADLREKFWIAFYNSFGCCGYNMTVGGGGGNTISSWSEEDKKALWKRQGNSRRGKVVSEETRLKISSAQLGRCVPSERRLRQSATRKRRIAEGLIDKPFVSVKCGKEHHGYTEVPIEDVLEMIKSGYKLVDITRELSLSKYSINARLLEHTGKIFTDWRKEYEITE